MKRKSLQERFDEKFIPEPNSGCWLWLGSLNSTGYGAFYIPPKRMGAHRAAYEIYIGQVPEKKFVLHSCDMPCCVNPNHLFLGTHQENMNDMLRKGRSALNKARGEKHCRAKLTAAAVLEIRLSKETTRALAKKYGVHHAQIHNARTHKSWAWL